MFNMEKVRIKLPIRLHWENCTASERRLLIDTIYQQSSMKGLIKLSDKSITCNIEEKEMIKNGIKEALQYLKKMD